MSLIVSVVLLASLVRGPKQQALGLLTRKTALPPSSFFLFILFMAIWSFLWSFFLKRLFPFTFPSFFLTSFFFFFFFSSGTRDWHQRHASSRADIGFHNCLLSQGLGLSLKTWL